jgi:Cu(I)/Ag(I) efflux system membrane fusion protein
MIKYKLMKNYILGLVLLTLFSCTNNNTGNTDATADSSIADSTAVKTADASSETELSKPVEQAIYDGYIALKNALVAANFVNAKKLAADLSKSLKAREGCENTALIADKISSAKDIAAQRKEFTALSSDVIALFRHADLKKGVIYVQHCPMANGGNGGDWLANEQKIQNPYYGDEMMECGAVVEEIKTAKAL